MPLLKTNNPLALGLLMTDDLYSVDEQLKESSVTTIPAIEESVLFNYLGDNNKYILILVDDPAHDIINPADLVVLTSILTAKNLELRDIAILNLSKHPQSDFKQFKEYFSCSKLVLLGMNPAQIGLQDISSNEISIFEGTKILASYAFAEMQTDVTKKRLFWNEMKKL